MYINDSHARDESEMAYYPQEKLPSTKNARSFVAEGCKEINLFNGAPYIFEAIRRSNGDLILEVLCIY